MQQGLPIRAATALRPFRDRRLLEGVISRLPAFGELPREELEVLAADNVKRVVHAGSDQSPWEISAFLELKTVWHPIGT